jgi:non-specific serine/threonine protein kinase
MHLGAHAFDLLLALVERSGHLVTKDDLLGRVWGRVIVEENTLQSHISALRKVLGREAITTVSGQGYRFALEVTRFSATATAAAPNQICTRPCVSSAVEGNVGLAVARQRATASR